MIFKKYVIHRQEITDDEAKMLRELMHTPYWGALIKELGNQMDDIKEEIVEGRDDRRSLDVLQEFKGRIEGYSKEKAPRQLPSLR